MSASPGLRFAHPGYLLFLLESWAPLAYIIKMSERPLTVAETTIFIRQAADIWDDAGREALVNYLARHPEAGDVIPATGGVRKLR